jgi:hypothetical protein
MVLQMPKNAAIFYPYKNGVSNSTDCWAEIAKMVPKWCQNGHLLNNCNGDAKADLQGTYLSYY